MQKHNPTKDHVKHLKKMASKLGGTSSVRMDAIVVETIEHDKKIHGLIIGSDVEIAKRVQKDLIKQYGDLVHAEGAFWRFRKLAGMPFPNINFGSPFMRMMELSTIHLQDFLPR